MPYLFATRRVRPWPGLKNVVTVAWARNNRGALSVRVKRGVSLGVAAAPATAAVE